MKLLFIRHGDPDYSIDSLTPTGWKEAELAALRLEKMDIRAIYCSPLGRARDTARPALEKLGRQAQILPWLEEFPPKVLRPHKSVEGVAWDWLPQDWTADKRFYHREEWMNNERFVQASVGEKAAAVGRELDALLAQYGYVRDGECYRAEQPNEDTLVFFCHFGILCVMLSHLLGISPMPLWHGMCAAPSSFTVLTTEERRKGIASFRMNTFGDTSHLYAGGAEPSFAARFCETFDNREQRHD